MERVRNEDVRRLGTEINQLLNQQFLITTAAITLFGIFAAGVTPKETSSPLAKQFLLLLVALVSLLASFAMLHHWNNRLGHLIASIAAYLHVTDASDWEKDIQKLGPGEHTGTLQRKIFLFLGVLSIAWALSIAVATGQALMSWRLPALLATFVAYWLAIRDRKPIGTYEAEWRSRWQAIVDQRVPPEEQTGAAPPAARVNVQ